MNSKIRILIIEKNSKTSSFLNKCLTDNNYHVFIESENNNLLLSLQTFDPDLVIVNQVSLTGDDSEILLSLNVNVNRKKRPILFLNKIEEVEIFISKNDNRIVDLISSPLQINELLFRINRLIALTQNRNHNDERIHYLEEEIIDQKLEKLVIQERADRLANILDSVEAFIYIKDTDYHYQYANKKLRDLFGKSMEEIINKDDFEFFDITTAANLRENDTQVIEFGKRLAEEEVNTGKDGLITTAFLSVKLPLFSETGKVYALCGISTEITKRKQAEIDLQRTLDLLEEQHKQLKAAQARLIQAEKMAGLGTLVAGVAHELNNPTNYIFISSNTLQTELESFKNDFNEMISESDIETTEYFGAKFNKFDKSLQNILDGSERIRMIVLDLRSFSRLDESEKKEASLIETIESTLRITKTQFQNSIEVIVNYNYNKSIECYPAQLGQVFLNILLNSYQSILEKQSKYNSKEVGEIIISLEGDSKEVRIIFSDNGVGMSEEVKSKMFEPFFTTKSIGQGTGLGLSISYGIIENHNGRIEVESKELKGTKITITLPVSSN